MGNRNKKNSLDNCVLPGVYYCLRMKENMRYAVLAQSVARRLGKAEVGGSSPLDSFYKKVYI